MAAVDVQSALSGFPLDKPVETFSEKASAFVTVLSTDKDGKIVEAPAKPGEIPEGTPVFALNSSDFIALQLYLESGLKLPQSGAAFEGEYPRDAFKTYMGKDPTLYDYMKEQLPKVHDHCVSFKGKTVGPMINMGGYISNFSIQAIGYTEELVANIETISDRKIKSTDDEFLDAKENIQAVLRKLKEEAKKTGGRCVELTKELSEFQVLTESDKEIITKMNDRFDAAIPSEEERSKTLNGLLMASKALLKSLKDQADEAHKKAVEMGKDKWYYYLGWVGVIILIVDRIRQKGLINSANDLQNKYQDAQAKDKGDEAKLTKAFNEVNSLSHSIDDIGKTIQGAIDAVGKMSANFSNMATDLDLLESQLSSAEGDVSADTVSQRKRISKDLEKAQKTWGQVQEVAKKFQQHGKILAAKEDIAKLQT